MGAAIDIRVKERMLATKLQVVENMVRSRLDYGGPLKAHEIERGVSLTHDEFLFLVQLVMPQLNRILAEA
jgi:hypothetical protein